MTTLNDTRLNSTNQGLSPTINRPVGNEPSEDRKVFLNPKGGGYSSGKTARSQVGGSASSQHQRSVTNTMGNQSNIMSAPIQQYHQKSTSYHKSFSNEGYQKNFNHQQRRFNTQNKAEQSHATQYKPFHSEKLSNHPSSASGIIPENSTAAPDLTMIIPASEHPSMTDKVMTIANTTTNKTQAPPPFPVLAAEPNDLFFDIETPNGGYHRICIKKDFVKKDEENAAALFCKMHHMEEYEEAILYHIHLNRQTHLHNAPESSASS